jgi:thiol-disulfide isomerase/thioredoxin
MKKYWVATAVTVILAGAAFTAARSRRPQGPHSAATAIPSAAKSGGVAAAETAEPQSAGGQTAVIRFAKNPEPAPAFLTHDLDGNVISSVDLKGKVTLITFWATWCGPCRAEIPELIQLQKEFPDKLRVIGISVDEDGPEHVKKFAGQAGINYPIIMVNQDLVHGYGGVPALPTTFVLNTDGGIVQKHVGLYPIEVFDREIRSLLGMPVDATVETFEDHGQIFLKNAANASELPGVELAGLTAAQKKAALHRMNAESCDCGCGLTIAQCRINDSACSVSKGLAKDIVKSVLQGEKGPKPAAESKPATTGLPQE